MDYPLSRGLYTRLLYGRGVDGLIAISQGVKAAMCAGGVPQERIRVIYSGIEMQRFSLPAQVREEVRRAYQIGEGEKVVITVAALEERKGHRSLLQAAALLKENGCRLRYLLCGEGSLQLALEKEVRALGLGSGITFVGFCRDVPRLLAAGDIFVHPPLWEGLGVVVLEAMAAGLPVVASRVGGIPEVVEDQVTGLLFPAGEGPALAAAVLALIKDPGRARAMGEWGRRRVQERFSMEAMARANETFYREVALSRQRSAKGIKSMPTVAEG
jgi:glycosyltransferase involved in cell wall biosynthesis